MARCQSVLLSPVLLHSTPQVPDAVDTPPFFTEMNSVTISGLVAPSFLKSLLQYPDVPAGKHNFVLPH